MHNLFWNQRPLSMPVVKGDRPRMGNRQMNLPHNNDEAIHTGRKDHTVKTKGCIRMGQKDFDDLAKLLEGEPIDEWDWYKNVTIKVDPIE